MICKQCGQSVPDGIKFCPACGVAVEAESVAEPVAAPVVKAKKKGKKGLIAVLVSLVAVAALAAVAVLTPLKNIFIGLMPAEKHMQYVYAEAAKGFGEDIGEVYGTVVTQQNASGAASGTIELKVSSALMSELESAIDVDLGDLNKIAIDYAVAADDDNEFGYTLALKLQDKELLTLKIYMDMQSGEMVMEVPGVLKKPIKVEAFDPAQLATANANMLADIKTDSLPDSAFVSELIPQLVRAAFTQIEDVDRSKKALEVGEVEQKATLLKAEITMETVAHMADAVLEELKNNKKLEQAIIGFCDDNAELLGDVDGDEVYKAFADAMDEGQDELKDVDDDEELFTLETWVNGKNDIIALSVSAEGAEIFIGKAANGDKVGYEISVKSGDREMLYIGGEGTEKNDVLDAEFAVKVEGEEYVKLAIEGYDLKAAEEGYINGVFTITPGKALAEMESLIANAALEITSSMSENSGEMLFDVQMQGASLGKLRLTVKADEASDVTIPSNGVAADELTSDMLDAQALLDKLENAGITEDMINSFAAMLMGSSDDAYSENVYGDYL